MFWLLPDLVSLLQLTDKNTDIDLKRGQYEKKNSNFRNQNKITPNAFNYQIHGTTRIKGTPRDSIGSFSSNFLESTCRNPWVKWMNDCKSSKHFALEISMKVEADDTWYHYSQNSPLMSLYTQYRKWRAYAFQWHATSPAVHCQIYLPPIQKKYADKKGGFVMGELSVFFSFHGWPWNQSLQHSSLEIICRWRRWEEHRQTHRPLEHHGQSWIHYSHMKQTRPKLFWTQSLPLR